MRDRYQRGKATRGKLARSDRGSRQVGAAAFACPNPGDIGNDTALPEPSCASPTDRTNERAVHQTICNGSGGAGAAVAGVGGGSSGGAGGSDAAIVRHEAAGDDGCQCRLGPADSRGFAWAWLCLAVWAARRRR